jgi:integration host factor subunit beta
LSLQTIDKIVDLVFKNIVECLADGGRVELRGFGAFTTRARAARTGRNPRTGDEVEVPAKRVPHFKPGKEMRERLKVQR